MPEDRADIDRRALRRSELQPQCLQIDIRQRAQSADQVERMRRGEHVEERTAWIRSDIYARRLQLQPRQPLSAEKQHAEPGAERPPGVELGPRSRLQRAPRHLQRGTRK